MNRITCPLPLPSLRWPVAVRMLVACGLLALVTLLGNSAGVIAAPSQQATGQTWTVYAGVGAANNRVATLQFYPQTLTIDVGDSVTWAPQGNGHVVAFLSGAPVPGPDSPDAVMPAGGSTYDGTGVAKSGLMFPPDAMATMAMMANMPTSYTLQFTAPGSFTYYCLIHPGMQGTVVVQPAGTPYPETQAQYDAEMHAQSVAPLAAAIQLANSYQVSSTTDTSGHTTWYLAAGVGTGSATVLRFLPTDLVIQQGDTVVWTNTDPIEPHTVTFAGPDGKVPEPEDPNAAQPAGNGIEDGSALNHSGFLVRLPGTASSPPYQLTFPRVGVFKYECVFHDPLGMYGTIVVTSGSQSQ